MLASPGPEVAGSCYQVLVSGRSVTRGVLPREGDGRVLESSATNGDRYGYYNAESPGLGAAFLEEVQRCIRAILAQGQGRPPGPSARSTSGCPA